MLPERGQKGKAARQQIPKKGGGSSPCSTRVSTHFFSPGEGVKKKARQVGHEKSEVVRSCSQGGKRQGIMSPGSRVAKEKKRK